MSMDFNPHAQALGRMKLNRKDYEEQLNELEVPFEDIKSNGGRIPDNAKLGTWTRQHDPIAFSVGYNELERNTR